MNISPEEFNEHAIASGTAGLAKHRQPLPDVQQHLNSDGEPCDCGETPPQPGLIHYVQAEQYREVGPQAVPTLVSPPKYGPPPGFSAEKWRGMNRAERRAQLKAVAHTINKVAK